MVVPLSHMFQGRMNTHTPSYREGKGYGQKIIWNCIQDFCRGWDEIPHIDPNLFTDFVCCIIHCWQQSHFPFKRTPKFPQTLSTQSFQEISSTLPLRKKDEIVRFLCCVIYAHIYCITWVHSTIFVYIHVNPMEILYYIRYTYILYRSYWGQCLSCFQRSDGNLGGSRSRQFAYKNLINDFTVTRNPSNEKQIQESIPSKYQNGHHKDWPGFMTHLQSHNSAGSQDSVPLSME